MLFHLGKRAYDLGSARGFLAFPMSLRDKAGFVRLMLKAFNTRDWSDWQDRSAADLVDTYAGRGTREALFERLTRLKFELPCEEVSGAWLGARLHYPGGLGAAGLHSPGQLDQGPVRRRGAAAGRRGRPGPAQRHGDPAGHGGRAGTRGGAEYAASASPGDLFVSTIPTEVYLRLLAGDRTPELERIRYSALISVICATRQPGRSARLLDQPGLARSDRLRHLSAELAQSHDRTAGGQLRQLRHPPSRARPAAVPRDGRRAAGPLPGRLPAGIRLRRWSPSGPTWPGCRCTRPCFGRSFRNPPVRSASWENVYFAGNYRTFPSIVSTGTALGSGTRDRRGRAGGSGRSDGAAGHRDGFPPGAMPRA